MPLEGNTTPGRRLAAPRFCVQQVALLAFRCVQCCRLQIGIGP